MVNMSGIVQQLKEEHDRLSRQLQGISAALSAFGAAYGKGTGAGTMSAAGRARISAAQKERWAKREGERREVGENRSDAQKADDVSRRQTEDRCRATRSAGPRSVLRNKAVFLRTRKRPQPLQGLRAVLFGACTRYAICSLRLVHFSVQPRTAIVLSKIADSDGYHLQE
jgi:hypothetical protein